MTRIKQLRKLLDYTQAKMASQLGVARSTVSMWEVAVGGAKGHTGGHMK